MTSKTDPTSIETEDKPGCCGGPAPTGTSACCALDANVKASGGAGCGCGATAETPAPAPAPPTKGCC